MSRTLASPLSTYLANRAFLPVDLYELVIGGTTYRYTTAAANVTGIAPATVATYTAGFMQSGAQRAAAGLVADDLEVTVLAPLETVGGKTWVARALDGDLDGCAFKRFEGYLDPAALTLVGCVEVFRGDVAEVEPSSTSVRMVVSVPSKRFDARFPTLSVQPGCVWDFGSAGCGYAGTKDFTATLAAGSTSTKLYLSSLPGGLPGTSTGLHQFVAGAALAGGYRRAVVDVYSTTYLIPSPPFPAGVIEGLIGSAGALSLRLGCNKTIGVCDSDAWGYKRATTAVGFLGAPRTPSEKAAT